MQKHIIDDSTKASQVINHLRNDILNKNFKSGSRITIKQIADLYGVSHMPVREAFRALEGEKLLEINPYKGATILNIDEQYIRNVYGLLASLELLIYESVLDKIDDDVIERLYSINKSIYDKCNDEEGRKECIKLNTEFHKILVSLTPNTQALDLYNYYYSLTKSLRAVYTPDKSRFIDVFNQHEKLITAIQKKDVMDLKNAVDTHVYSAMRNFFKEYQDTEEKE